MGGTLTLFNELVDVLEKEGASDLHLSQDRVPVIRVSGFLIPLEKYPPLTESDIKGFLELFLISENQREFALRKETNFAYSHKNGSRFRGNVFETVGKVSVALRLIPTKVKTFEELNLPPVLKDFAGSQPLVRGEKD